MSAHHPFRRVLAGVDGGHGGRDAVALARTLAPAADRLALVHVDVLQPEGAVVAEYLRDEDVRRDLDELAAAAARALPSARVDARRLLAPAAADGLAQAAGELGADLLVVGSSARGAAARVLLGDDTRAVLRRAPCAVAVAPAGFARAPAAAPARIGVGYGTDPASARALDVARALRGPGGSLAVTHMEPVPVLPLPLGAVGVLSVPAREQALAEAERVLAEVDDADLRHAGLGYVRDGLLELGQEADLLVVGLHRRSVLGRLLHPGAAESVLRSLPCPLLAIPEEPGPG